LAVSLADGVRHPKVYAYTTNEYKDTLWQGDRDGIGLLKVGYTDRDVRARIAEQIAPIKKPVPTSYDLVVSESAITDDGRVFTDHEVHAALTNAGVHRAAGEWFECGKEELLGIITSIRGGAASPTLRAKKSFPMRPEQEAAVERTAAYFESHLDLDQPPHFLWNAKMRFGKTFTTYQLAKRLGWTRVLVLTYKPAVETGWREDLLTHADFEGWRFKGKQNPVPDLGDESPLVWFASFQDVLGVDDEGNPKAKNEGLYQVKWDAVVIDEYHFGAWRDAARSLYVSDRESGIVGDSSEKAVIANPDLEEDFVRNLEESVTFSVRNYLYLSGTPFRALTEGEFLEDQVFNWTYSDEQRVKESWPGPGRNPYLSLPRMHLLTYEMPDQLKEAALNNQSQFSLTEFFRTERHEDGTRHFAHEGDVQKWLDLLRGQDIAGLWASVSSQNRPPLPYEDTNLLRALQHTVWYLPSVDACHAMRDLLTSQHNVYYRDYEVIVAAGPGAGLGERALPPVKSAIGKVPQDTKTITVTCGKLLTGVTVPPWTGIFMLRELKSPESYFQAAFRVQSPWVNKLVNPEVGGEDEVVLKEQCYVFDFAPNRALQQIVDYATRLGSESPEIRNDEAAVAEFMEFLPVLSFDGYSMQHLSAADVIDYLTKGISASMLARRWNSAELIALDLASMERLLANPSLLQSLEQIEMFRNITDDLTALIATNKELRGKSLAKEKLNEEETKARDEAANRRTSLRDRLRRFVTRVPAFMYLTDDREKTVRDIIQQLEPALFEKVTGLSLSDFEQLVQARVFNDTKMNDAVWKFREFERPSLQYGEVDSTPATLGGWTLRRDERFSRLIIEEILPPGAVLTDGEGSRKAIVSADYGLLIDGIRYESPDLAAAAVTAGAVVDGWRYWHASTEYGDGTLEELAALDQSNN
jgi:hypothetical protein